MNDQNKCLFSFGTFLIDMFIKLWQWFPYLIYIREGNRGISGFQASLFVCTQGNYEKMYEIN